MCIVATNINIANIANIATNMHIVTNVGDISCCERVRWTGLECASMAGTGCVGIWVNGWMIFTCALLYTVSCPQS